MWYLCCDDLACHLRRTHMCDAADAQLKAIDALLFEGRQKWSLRVWIFFLAKKMHPFTIWRLCAYKCLLSLDFFFHRETCFSLRSILGLPGWGLSSHHPLAHRTGPGGTNATHLKSQWRCHVTKIQIMITSTRLILISFQLSWFY